MSPMQRRQRIADLTALRQKIDDELSLLQTRATPGPVKRSPYAVPPCGTESGYQRHRNRGENCDECRVAHANHERAKRRQQQREAWAS